MFMVKDKNILNLNIGQHLNLCIINKNTYHAHNNWRNDMWRNVDIIINVL